MRPVVALLLFVGMAAGLQGDGSMYIRIVYGSVDMVYETQNTTEQIVILNYTTHEVLCFNFNKKTDDTAEVSIFSQSFSGSCTGTVTSTTIYTARETVVGSGPDGDLSMMVVSAPPPTPGPAPGPTPPPTATPTPTQPSSNMYLRIVYGSVDLVYETQESTSQHAILDYTTQEVLCFNFETKTDDIAQVIIFSQSFYGSCSGTWPGWVQIYEWTTVVGSGPDGNLSMTIVSAPPPTPGPAPIPSYPNMYFRIVYGSVDMVYATQNTNYQNVILDNSTHEVLCFNFQKDTDAIAVVNIYSESLSGSCSGEYNRQTIYAAWETVVGSGPEGDLSMMVVSAPPPTPGPAPSPTPTPTPTATPTPTQPSSNMYLRIVYGSVDMVYETKNTREQDLILSYAAHEALCFNFNKKTDDIAEVIFFSESLSGSCTGTVSRILIYAAWETVVGSGPDGNLSMTIVAAPTPAPTPTPTAVPTPLPTAAPTPTQPSAIVDMILGYGGLDMVYITQRTTEQIVILNYTTHEVLCFYFNKETDDIAQVSIFSESFSGSCTGTVTRILIYADWETVVGSGADGNLSMMVVAPTPPPTAVPTPSPGSDDKLEIILIVLSATIVVILLVFAIMMYKSRHPPVPPITPVVDEDPIQTDLLPECERIE